jgi:hypothetical protein
MKIRKLFKILVLGGATLGLGHCGGGATPSPGVGTNPDSGVNSGNPNPDAGSPGGRGGPVGW